MDDDLSAGRLNWRIASASVIGTSHAGSGLPCQDAHRCAVMKDATGSHVLVVAVADGAGGARRAERGANLAVAAFHQGMAQFLSHEAAGALSPALLRGLVAGARAALVAEAQALREPLQDLACTFLAAVAGPDSTAFCQIGDGAIIVSEPGEGDDWSWVFWPQRGEYANATSFLTDDGALDAVELATASRRIDELSVLTDGLEPMVLLYRTKSVFTPFFRTMFAPLRLSPATGQDEMLSRSLGSYLNSSQINRRTNDDKTLILATRRRAAAAAG